MTKRFWKWFNTTPVQGGPTPLVFYLTHVAGVILILAAIAVFAR